MNKLITETISRTLLIAANIVSILVTIPYLNQMLTSEEFSMVTFGLFYYNLSNIISLWGINFYSIEVTDKQSIQFKDKFFCNFYFINLSMGILMSFILMILGFFKSFSVEYILFLSLAIVSFALVPLWYLSLKSIVSRFISIYLIIKLIFIYIVTNPFYVINHLHVFQMISITNLMIIFGAFVLLKNNKFKFYKPKIKKVFGYFKSSFSFFYFNLVSNGLISLLAVLVASLHSLTLSLLLFVGDYIYRAGNILTNTFLQSILINYDFKNYSRINIFFYLVLFILLSNILVSFNVDIILGLFGDIFFDADIVTILIIQILSLVSISKIYIYLFFESTYLKKRAHALYLYISTFNIFIIFINLFIGNLYYILIIFLISKIIYLYTLRTINKI